MIEEQIKELDHELEEERKAEAEEADVSVCKGKEKCIMQYREVQSVFNCVYM